MVPVAKRVPQRSPGSLMNRISTQNSTSPLRCIAATPCSAERTPTAPGRCLHRDVESAKRMPSRLGRGLLCFFLVNLLAGCVVRQILVHRVDDSIAQSGEVYASDPDVELVGAATPFALKLIESLLAESPKHRGLLLAAARGFTQYAYAYVENPADELEAHNVDGAYVERERARKLYVRARDYGLRGLSVAYPGFT